MKNIKNPIHLGIVMLTLLCSCSTPRKACQVERISFQYRQDMIDAIGQHPAMMRDILKTMAELENETGHYQ